jgi:MFS family permease
MVRKHLAFIGIITCVFVAFIDYMIVNNALPSIQHAFGVSMINLQWVTNIYSIIIASTMILFGRIGDIFGKKRVFYTGMFLLGLGSLAAGFSPTFAWLIFFRLIQSIGVAAMIVIAPPMIQMIYKENTHKPMSIFASVGGLGLVLGPAIGGLIISHWRWEGVFWVNIPFLIIGFIICIIALSQYQEETDTDKKSFYHLDLFGNLFLCISLSTLIFTLIQLEQYGLSKSAIIAGIIFLISLPCLIYTEKTHKNPTLDLSHMQNCDFRLAILCNAAAGTVVSCGMFFSPIFLQKILGYSPTMSGFILLAFAIVVLVASPVFGFLPKSITPKHIIRFGLLSAFIAALAYIVFFYHSLLALGIIAFALTGLVLSINNVYSAISAIAGLGQDNAGASVGTIFATFNMMAAITLGIASILFHDFTNEGHLSITSAYAFTFIFVAAFTGLLWLLGFIGKRRLVTG